MLEASKRVLQAIQTFILPLKPPVLAFEESMQSSPLRILISVLLSARSKDQVTEKAARQLFAAAQSAAEIAALGSERIAGLIFPVGFYRQKARHIVELCTRLNATEHFPATFDELVALPGIGRKSANIVLAQVYGVPTIAVDTHVFRIAHRFGWARGGTPAKVEAELQALFPQGDWLLLNRTLVGFGQTVCMPRQPHCPVCFLAARCPYARRQQKK